MEINWGAGEYDTEFEAKKKKLQQQKQQTQQTVAQQTQPEQQERKTVSTMDFYGTKVDPYQSQVQPKISQFVDDITGYKPFDYSTYDPNKDAAFTAFRDRAIEQGEKAYSSNLAASAVPGVADSSIGRKVAESARSRYTDQIQDAIPTFMEKARQDYDNLFNRKVQTLGILRDVENVDYGRYIDDRNRQDSLSRQYTQDTGYVPVDTSLIPMDSYLRTGIPDYSAEINKRKAVDPNDPMIPVLTALRMEKIMNDPELFKKYGSTMELPVGQKTDSRQSYEETRDYNAAQDTKNWDYKAERDKIADSRYDTEWNYGTGQDEKQWNYQTERDKINDARYADETAFERSLKNKASKLDWLKYEDSQKQDALMDQADEQFNDMYEQMMMSGSPAEWLEANKVAIGYDNYIKLGKLVDSPQKSGSVFTAADYFRRINDLMQPDKDGKVNFTVEQAIDMLANSPLNSNDKLEVAQMLGIYDQVLEYYEKMRMDEAEAVRMKNR